MALAITRTQFDTSPWLCFYTTWHYTKTRHWRAETEAHWHLGPYSLGHHRRSQWQTRLRACVKTKGRHFEHLLWSSHTTGSHSLHTHQNQFFSEPLTPLRGKQQVFRFCVIPGSVHGRPQTICTQNNNNNRKRGHLLPLENVQGKIRFTYNILLRTKEPKSLPRDTSPAQNCGCGRGSSQTPTGGSYSAPQPP